MEVDLGRSKGIEDVLGLDRLGAIALLFEKMTKIELLEHKLEALQDLHISLEMRYEALVMKNEDRLDSFIKQNERIVNSKMDLDRPAAPKDMKPVSQTRKPWARVAATYEAKSRKAYWEGKIAETEAKMGEVMNTAKKDETA